MIPSEAHREDGPLETRVLVLSARQADKAALCQVLSGAGLQAEPCSGMEDLCRKMSEGAGTAILTEKVLASDAVQRLSTALADQPPWSDFPLILLTSEKDEGADIWRLLREVNPSGHLILLERPLHAAALISAVRTALQSRRRQYEMGDLLAERQLLIDAVPVLLGYVDREERYRFVNRAHEEMFGLSREETVGRTVREVIGDELYQRIRGHLRRALRGETTEYEITFTSSRGSQRILLARLTPGGHAKGVHFAAVDITEARQAVTARTLSTGLIQGQEEERRRIARELHDDFVQRTAYLAIELDTVSMRSEEVDEALRPAREQLILLSDDMRRLSHQLHPSILDDLGLAVAIRHECENMQNLKGLPVDFRARGDTNSLSKGIQLSLYRIVQEALNNVGKHAQASGVKVSLERNAREVQLSIEDDGVGFDPAAPGERRGIGLSTMRERIRAFQGELNVRTKPGAGTKVEVVIPASKATDSPAPQGTASG